MINFVKIKGTHNAIKSGIIGAESIFEQIKNNNIEEQLINYEEKMQNSEIFEELKKVKTAKAGFKKGIIFGMINAGLESLFGYSLIQDVKY